MALYAFDGTGNEDQDRDERDRNVVDFFNAYSDPTKNVDPDLKEGSLYLKGIGTRARTFFGRGPSEAFGIGGHRRVRQALERLENNAGVPIAPEAIVKNLLDRGLPQQISDHKVDSKIERKFFASDRLHSSVVIGPGIGGRPHNNPAMTLSCIDDEGMLV
jgi:hypothetical protein